MSPYSFLAVIFMALLGVFPGHEQLTGERIPDAAPPATSSVSSLARLPRDAQVMVSTAIGRNSRAYHFVPTGNEFHAENGQLKLSASVRPNKLDLAGGRANWSFGVDGLGYGNESYPVGECASSHVIANRVEFRCANLIQWYVNGPIGLEQGFTLTHPPHKANTSGPLSLSMSMPENTRIVVYPGQTSATLTRADGSRLLYTGLVARDASNKPLPAWMESRGEGILLRVRDDGATYPLVIDPIFESAELTASDGVPGDSMGISVAISGNTVVAGAQNATVGSNAAQGAAYVFVKSANGWQNMTETAKLTSSDGRAGDGFGGAVSIAGDTILVGACSQSGMCNGTGAAYIFVRPAGGWKTTSTFNAKLTPSNGTLNNGFSNMLQISADGKTIVIGAWGTNIGGNISQGEAYVYVKPSTGWKTATETARLGDRNGAAFDDFGNVSISGDGGTIFVGAIQINISTGVATGPGKAYIFLRPAGGWKSTTAYAAKLTASDGVLGDWFGFCQAGSVCLSSDGTTVIAAAPNSSNGGRAYVFVEPPRGWKTTSQFTAELTASDVQSGNNFGWSAAITSYAALLGAVSQNAGQGASYVYVKPQGGWKTTSHFSAKLIASDGTQDDLFGFSLGVSGKTVVVGAVNHPTNGSPGPGAAYVFGH